MRHEYFLIHNDHEVENVKVISFLSHHKVYNFLRSFTLPQYNETYLMRHKKGYNTLFFQQNYDIVVTDANGLIIYTKTDEKPGVISQHFENGYFIFFMVVGSINHHSLKVKDRLETNKKYYQSLKM